MTSHNLGFPMVKPVTTTRRNANKNNNKYTVRRNTTKGRRRLGPFVLTNLPDNISLIISPIKLFQIKIKKEKGKKEGRSRNNDNKNKRE